MRLLILLCATFCCAPAAPEEKPFTLNIGLMITEETKVIIDLPVQGVGPKTKLLTKEEFRKNAKEIMSRKYAVKQIVTDGMVIKILHFKLPPVEEDEEEDEKPKGKPDLF